MEITSRSTKKGAIKNAWARLSKRAGARFCRKLTEFKCVKWQKMTHKSKMINGYLKDPMANKLSRPT